MGLSVNVFSKLRKVEGDNWNVYIESPYQEFAHKVENFETSQGYQAEEHNDLSINYGYSTHNRFREWLLSITDNKEYLQDDGRIDWDKLDQMNHIAFYELINFSDCQGHLDWVCCQSLLKDFENWKEVANKDENEMFVAYYNEWHELMKVAAQECSVVEFT